MASRLQYKLALAQQEESEKNAKNKGNALSYLGKNLGAGALGMFEGAYDFIAGGAASLFGNDEYAKYLQANDISGRIQKEAMQEFNPSKGWQFAGDVASGLGQTAAGVGVGLLTGGLGGGAVATKLAVGATIGAGAAGKSTGAAFQKTGELGAKEYTYGALSGALEMGLETLTGAGGKIASRLTSQTATAVAKNAVRSGIVKTMISEGAGEFVEEALSEILDAPLQRITGVDKEAENAQFNDVVRAGLVGFVSGAIGSGIGSSAQNVSNFKRGANIEKNGQTESILNRANTLKNEIVDNAEDVTLVAEPLKALSASVTAYENVKKQDSVKGKMLLGEIQKGLAYVEVSSGVQYSYNNIVKEADAIANTAYFKDNYKDYTAEDIRSNKNDIAKELAVNDFVGKMMISPEEYASTLKKGELPVGATKYQEFIAQADGNTIKRLSVELGIDLNTANYEEVRRHLADYSKTKGKSIADGQIATYLNAIFGDVMEVDENGKINTKIKKLPKNIKVAVGEKAIYKTKDGTIVGIVHHQKGYFVGIDEAFDGEKGFQTANTLNESEFARFMNVVRRKFNGETDTAVKATTKAQKTSKAKETKVADVKEENKTNKAEVKKEEVVIDSQKLKALEELVASDEGVEETKDQKDVNSRLKKEQAKARALEIIKQKGTEKAKTAEDTKYAVKDKKQESKVKAETRGDLTQAKETARKYVKDFDMYDTDTKGRIVEAIISGEQYKVDETTQRAIANILAVRKNLNVSFSNIAENGMYYTIKNEKGATQRYAVINPSTNIVRQTILHELTHDLEGDARFEAMANVALQNTPKEKVDAKRKLYEKHYKKIGKVFNEDILTAEITADYFAEQLGESKFIEQYATNEDLGIFQRAKRWLSGFVAKLPLGKAKTEAIKLNRLYDRLIQSEWKGVEGTARIKHSLNEPKYSLSKDLELLFDEDFYEQFKNESKTIITESISELEAAKANPNFESMSFDEAYGINAKLRALKAGYSNLYDYYVGKEKERLTKDYNFTLSSGMETYASSLIKEKQYQIKRNKQLDKDIASSSPFKNAQFDIVKKANPAPDNKLVWVRSPKDIKTFEETINDKESFEWGDFSREDALKALKRGTIRLYSSFPIKNGTFVSTSYQQALDYAGGDPSKVHSRIASLYSVAWINGDEGQYAKVYNVQKESSEDIRYSLADRNGKKLTKEQAENPYTVTNEKTNVGTNLTVGQVLHHKDSQARDEQGRLLEVYHGTRANDFSIFEISHRQGRNKLGKGIYFTKNKNIANSYKNVKGYDDEKGRVVSAYINMKNPFIIEETELTDTQINFLVDSLNREDLEYDKITKESITTELNAQDNISRNFAAIDLIDKYAVEYGEQSYNEKTLFDILGYDGIIAENFDEYVVFSPNQIKLTTNLNPTVSEDIRFSVDEVDTMDVVQTEVEEKEVALKTILKNKRYTKIAANNFIVSTQIMFTNDMAGIERVLKSDAKTAKKAEAVSQEFRTAQSKAMAKLGNYQYDTVKDIYKADIKGKELGKGVHAIFEPINRRGMAYLAKFEDYVYNKHNIDRMKVGKTVNGASQNQSKAIVAEYERTNPEFKKYMKEVTDFCKNELKMDFEAGVISEEDYNFYVKRYGNYVPSYRDMTAEEVEKSFALDTEMVRVNAIAKKKAKGGTIKILPLEYAIALQTMARERQIATNKMANLLYDAHLNGNTTDVTSVEKMEIDEADKKNPDKNYDKLTPKDNTVIFFRNGEQYSMQVSKYVFAGFDSLAKHFNKVDNAVVKAIEKANKGFKTLVTSANPLFIARNFSRDMQEALFYTKYGTAKFLKHYATAISQVKSNGDYWKLYQAMGGFNSSVFDFNTGKIAEVNARGFEKASTAGKLAMLKKVLTTCENANLLIEQLPRFAEFIASMESGNTAQQALVDSAEITCNFGRGGTLTRLLNRTIMPFLNPAVQGASKFIRNITGARTARAIGSLVLKAAILGILPQVLSMAMYKDDEEYQGMTDYIKESYWLFKIGDTWAKIPKGRVTAFITSTYIHGDKIAKGDDVWKNVKAVGKSFTQNLTPVENFGRTIFSPLYDIKTNTTWYGGSIENLGMAKAEPRNRYDESTSKIAIWLGDKINYSPKKIHYLFDQYSGIIGDILLPATNSKAEVDIFKSNFTVDPVTQNKYSQEFYDLVDEVGKAKDSALRAGDTEAETDNKLQARFLNNAQKGASAIYDEISKIQGSDLSNADKLAQVRVLRGTINQIYTTALTDIDAVREAIGATAYIDDYDLRYAEVTRLVYGAERALRTYNSKVYEKAQTINKAGISYQDYYEVYFKTRGIESEKDKQGNTIAGSKKKKVIKEIATLKIPTAQKLFLIYSQGYTIKDGEVKGFTEVRAKRVVATYIDELNLTAEEKKALIDLCGI